MGGPGVHLSRGPCILRHRSSAFAWQNHSKDQKEVLPYTEVLEFIDLHARATETLQKRAIGRVTVARNPLSTRTWLMFRIVVWHAKQSINYISVEIFPPCHTIGKWALLRGMRCA